MRIWKITSGHREWRSTILGDWIRNNYISLGTGYPRRSHVPRFFKEMRLGDKVVVVAEKHIYAIGEVKSKPRKPPRVKDEVYVKRRDVVWHKITKINYFDLPLFPKSLKKKLSMRPAIVPLRKKDWKFLSTLLRA